eukprot:CAMPEP_0117460660 /NCGR_PEP_ID=MMETSP0784-20121206/2122_1 /TAXON_ID=39447 /ORGANISM="" /LENGTH=244 /DNA_ID=CAMNT_0005254339 /DNA_START=485 /DNA_END=1216 /DNA_ORIENTATION=-
MACAESAIAELKSSVSQVRECVDQLFATPAAATTGSSTTASSSVGDAEKFVPKAIIVKGWCADYDDFARDKSLGLSKKQAIELWAFLKESSNELKKHIGEAEIRGQQVFSFRIKILDGDAYEVIQAWRTLTASKEFPHVTGQELRFTPEASPVRQAENSRFGRLFGFVQAKAGKEFVMASWHPYWTVEVMKDGGKNIFLVAAVTNGLIQWEDSAVAALGFSDMGSLRCAFARFRRRYREPAKSL